MFVSDLTTVNCEKNQRMILLMMIVVAMNGTFILEQPFGSLFEFYPRWRDFINALIRTGGENAVS